MPAKKKRPANLPAPETIVKMQRAAIAAKPLGGAKRVTPRIEPLDGPVPPDGAVRRVPMQMPSSLLVSVPQDGAFGADGVVVRVPTSIPAPPAYPLYARPESYDERGRQVVEPPRQGPLPEAQHNQYYGDLEAWKQEYLPLLRKSRFGGSI